MAKINADYGLNFDLINMSRLNNGSNYFYDNQNIINLGVGYEDFIELYWTLAGSNYLSGVFGSDLSHSGNILTGGTARGYIEMQVIGGSPISLWAMIDFNVPASEFGAAIASPSLSDDLALLTKLLSSNDTFKLSSYSDKVYGYAGNDIFTGGSGNDFLDGGSGVDTAILIGARSQYNVSITTKVVTDLITNRDGADTLTNIERLQFTDTMLALDIGKDQTAGSGYMLYKAAFNRTPDVGGLGFWINQMDKGMSYNDVAKNFVNSAEFKDAFGGSNPTVNTLVTKLYNNVLNRTPDAGGLAFWQEKLTTGWSTADVLGYFSTSAENVTNVTPLIANGIQYQQFVG